MRKRFFSCFLLAACFTALLSMGASADSDTDPVIKAGLYYGTGALPSANLANEIGSGYELGFFDANRAFVPIYAVSEEKISVLKDKTIYLAADKTYTDAKPATVTGAVYPYHAECGTVYESIWEAEEAANDLASLLGVPAFPAFVDGQARVRVGHYASSDSAAAKAAEFASDTGLSFRAAGGGNTCYTVTVTKSENILFEFDSNDSPLGIMPVGRGGQETQTWFKGYTYYGGFEYRRLNGGDLTVINVVRLHDYTKGVIPYEMGAGWPEEALKAQAMCAKSYALSNRNKHRSYGFDVCNTTDCQVYRGTNNATDYSDGIVDDTYGKFVTYNGEHITPYYHSSNGGATENSENIWTTAVPYLRGVFDPYEDLSTCINGIWQYDFDLDDATEILREKGYNTGKIVDVYVGKYTDMGNVYEICFADNKGEVYSFAKDKARSILTSSSRNIYTHSQRYSINTRLTLFINSGATTLLPSLQRTYAIGAGGAVRHLTPSYKNLSVLTSKGVSKVGANEVSLVVEGTGWGHNVGMSQNGAKGMALLGYTYEDILKFYFTGVEITSY